jgi:Ca2+-binding EF-hand superfamily protein
MSSKVRLALLAALGTLSAAAIAQSADGSSKFFGHMLQKWDANGDGKISLDEYLTAATVRFQQIDKQNTGNVSADQIANSPHAAKRIERRAKGLVKHLDSADKGYVTQDEFVAAAKTRFAKLDRNGDGKLTPDELGPAHRGKEPSAKHAEFAGRRFDKLDTNHDGVVTLNEYTAAAVAKFKTLDVAGNGRVSADEIANSPKAHERAQHVSERIVKRLDTNGDGTVSREEFLAAAKQRFARLDKNGDGFVTADEIGQRHWAHDGKPAFDRQSPRCACFPRSGRASGPFFARTHRMR